MRKVLILINPHSGVHSLERVNAPLAHVFRAAQGVEIHTHLIDGYDDSRRATLEAIQGGYYAVVVVGGDGTANSIGALLRGTDTALGLIPAGSGNGVARHIGMDTDIPKAFSQLLACHSEAVDTLEVNGRFCLGLPGRALRRQ